MRRVSLFVSLSSSATFVSSEDLLNTEKIATKPVVDTILDDIASDDLIIKEAGDPVIIQAPKNEKKEKTFDRSELQVRPK